MSLSRLCCGKACRLSGCPSSWEAPRASSWKRSDCFSPAEAQLAHTMGLSLWMPYFGSGMYPGDEYWHPSCIFPASRVGMDTRRPDQDYARLKRMMAEFRRVEPYLLGDFYPLTPHSLGLDVWVGWQYDRPERRRSADRLLDSGRGPDRRI